MNPDATIAEAEWAECEAVIKRFEDAWRGPARPDIDSFVPANHPLRARLLAELSHIDLELRLRAGDNARVEEYLGRYPELGRGKTVLELIAAEFRLRGRLYEPQRPDDYYNRFPDHRDALTALLSDGGPALTRTPHSSAEEALTAVTGPPVVAGCEIEGELGRGGMGIVYKARQPALNRTVAVKTLATAAPETCNRFRREAEAIARLDHPHIVPVYEVGEWQTEAGRAVPFFTMKWYPGGSLDAVPCGLGSDMNSHARVVETVAEAVHHAHQRGVLHRDLKPSNVLLDERRDPHVADFGLAGLFDPLSPIEPVTTKRRLANETQSLRASGTGSDKRSATVAVVGTPAYMAPEQASSPGRVTTAADVYGLGAVLYHLLTGRPPFHADTPYETLRQVASNPPVPPSMVNPAVPRDLEAICLKCLEKSPKDRYPSAAAVADDLSRWRAGLPVLARPAPPWEHALLWVRRYPVFAAMAFTTFVALVASVAVLAISNARIREKETEARSSLVNEHKARCEMEEILRREERLHYLERIGAAGRHYTANQLPHAWRLLDMCPKHLRGWEWYYLNARRRSGPVVLEGHREWVVGIAFLADGRVVSGDSSGMIHVWNPTTRVGERTWDCGQGSIHGLSAHPTRNWVAAPTAKGLTIWDADTGTRVRDLPGISTASFSPDGKFLAASYSEIVRIWSVPDWELRHELKDQKDGVSALTFAPDGQLVVGFLDGTVRVWNTSTGEAVTSWKRDGGVHRLAFTPDGKTLLEARDRMTVFADPASGALRGEIGIQLSALLAVASGPGPNQVVVAGSAGEVIVWDVILRRAVRTYRGHTYTVSVITSSPDGRRIASAGGDRTVRVWDGQKEPESKTLGEFGPIVGTLAVAPDDTRVAVGPRLLGPPNEDTIRILDSRTGREIRKLTGSGQVAFHPNSVLLAAGRLPGEVVVWNSLTGEPVWTRPIPIPDEQKKEEILRRGGRVAFSPDGKRLAAWQVRGKGIHIWNAANGAELQFLETRGEFINWIDFADGGQIAATSANGVMVWDADGKPILRLPEGLAVAWTPSGHVLAIAERDRTVRLRDGKTGEVLRDFLGSPVRVTCGSFNPDGSRLVTGSTDGSVRLWDVESGQELLTLLTGPEPIRAVEWSRGNRIFALTGSLLVWDAPME